MDERQEISLKRERRTFSRVGLAYAGLIVVTAAVQIGLALLVRHGLNVPIPQRYRILFTNLPMYLAGVPACVLLLKRVPGEYRPADCRWSLGRLAICFLISVSLMHLFSLLSNALMFGINALRHQSGVNPVAELIMGSDLAVVFLIAVIVGPVMEELLFRKLLIDRINRYGQGVSIWLSGLLFGLLHGNFYQFFTRSLWVVCWPMSTYIPDGFAIRSLFM